jgi:hypothetical protein
MPNAVSSSSPGARTSAKRLLTKRDGPKPDKKKTPDSPGKSVRPRQATVVNRQYVPVSQLSPPHTTPNTEPTKDNEAPCRKSKQPEEKPPAHQQDKTTRLTQSTPTGAKGRETGPARHQLKKDGAPLTRKSKQAGAKPTANQPAKASNKRKRDGTNEDDTRSTDGGGFFRRVIDFFGLTTNKKRRLGESDNQNQDAPSLGVGPVFSQPTPHKSEQINQSIGLRQNSSPPTSSTFEWPFGLGVFFGGKKQEGSSETSSESIDDGSSSDGDFDPVKSGFLTRELPKPPSETQTAGSSNGSRGTRVTNEDVTALFDKMKGQLAQEAITSVRKKSKEKGLNVGDYREVDATFNNAVEEAGSRKKISGLINHLEKRIQKKSKELEKVKDKISELKNPKISEAEKRSDFLAGFTANLVFAHLQRDRHPVELDTRPARTNQEYKNALRKKLDKYEAVKQKISKNLSGFDYLKQLYEYFLGRVNEELGEKHNHKNVVREFSSQATKKAGKKISGTKQKAGSTLVEPKPNKEAGSAVRRRKTFNA